MHKKDRPMLSVTSLLIRSPAPTTAAASNPMLYSNSNNNNNNNISNNNNGISSNSGMISPNGMITAAVAAVANGMSITGNGTAVTGSGSPVPGSLNLHHSNGNGGHIQQQQHQTSISNSPTGGSMGIATSCDTNIRYPPNHPLSGSKHLCAICEDRASGKHYGVYSCEGCKGFFKRTVRKDLSYVCRDERNCIVDKRQRNRCQYCRYQKCLEMGMKREAVQEERQRNKPENEPESSTNSPGMGVADSVMYHELNIDRLTEAERLIEITPEKVDRCSPSSKIATKEIELLFRWINHLPYFSTLHKDDQLTLLKSGWNELLIAEFSYRSTNEALLLANGDELSKQNVQMAGIDDIFGRVINELVAKMREIRMDQSELGCLKAIVLFNPATKGLKNSNQVEKLRDRVYSILEQHCRSCYQDKTSRFAKLLVRLPPLRSIGLKCVEHLFFRQFLAENNRKETIENFIRQMLDSRSNNNNHIYSFY